MKTSFLKVFIINYLHDWYLHDYCFRNLTIILILTEDLFIVLSISKYFLRHVCLYLIEIRVDRKWGVRELEWQRSPAWFESERLQLHTPLGHQDARDPINTNNSNSQTNPRSVFEYFYGILNTFITWNSI